MKTAILFLLLAVNANANAPVYHHYDYIGTVYESTKTGITNGTDVSLTLSIQNRRLTNHIDGEEGLGAMIFEAAASDEIYHYDYVGTVYESTRTNVANGADAKLSVAVIHSDTRTIIGWGLTVGGIEYHRWGSFFYWQNFALTPTGYRFSFGQEAIGGGDWLINASGTFTEAGGTMYMNSNPVAGLGHFSMAMIPVTHEPVLQTFQAAGKVWVNAPAGVLETTTNCVDWEPKETNEVARVFPAQAGRFYRVKLNDQ